MRSGYCHFRAFIVDGESYIKLGDLNQNSWLPKNYRKILMKNMEYGYRSLRCDGGTFGSFFTKNIKISLLSTSAIFRPYTYPLPNFKMYMKHENQSLDGWNFCNDQQIVWKASSFFGGVDLPGLPCEQMANFWFCYMYGTMLCLYLDLHEWKMCMIFWF